MIKVTDWNDVQSGMKVKVVASYRGFNDYAEELKYFVNEIGTVSSADRNTVGVRFDSEMIISRYPTMYINNHWWFPHYSLKFPGDSDSIKKSYVVEGSEYIIMKDLDTFDDNKYEDMIRSLGKFNEIYNDKYVPCKYFNKLDKLKIIQLITFNHESNDILAHCLTENGKTNSIFPLTALYGNPRPSYKPKKFVYEYNDWKNNIKI
jgi:hypothetical protein